MSSPSQPDAAPSSQAACCAAKQPGYKKGSGLPRRKTRPWLLVTGCVVALLALVFWGSLQRTCAAYFLLHSLAPSDEALSDAVEQASDPAALLTRLWHTQRLPHRQFVLTYLNRVSMGKPALFRQMESFVIKAAADPDVEARQLAFATLERLKHPQLRRLVLEQLSDADPAVRLIGLQNLRRIATSNDVHVAMQLLKDPEPRVVVAAALVLRKLTNLDFGIKSNHAIPQFTCIDTNPPPAPDLQAIQQGVQRWQEWWNIHQGEYQMPVPTFPPQSAAITLATADFNLEDAMGKPVQLSQFRGKTVLLAFWSPGAPASLDDMPALIALQRRNPERLAILGICIPPAPSCADEHQQGHDRAHHHHAEASAAGPGPGPMRDQVQQAADRLNISYPMLLDPKGTIGLRFSVNDLPAYVLIDAEGMIRRRFVGFRTAQALMAMVEEASSLRPAAAKLSFGANQH